MSMFRGLIVNTLISATAFLATATVPLLLVPLIVGHYGIAQYGLIVLSRILLPTGTLAVFDFGNSEIATQTIVQASHDGDWNRASRRLLSLTAISLVAGLVVSITLILISPHVGRLFKIPSEADRGFSEIILITGLLFTILLLTLVIEGILKGFEAFKSLRTAEVCCTIAYALATVLAITGKFEFQWIAFAYLGALLVRTSVLVLITRSILRSKGVRLTFMKPLTEDWQDIRLRCKGMVGNRTLGAAQSQAAPLIISTVLGPKAVGIYDLIIRFPRFLKIIMGLMNTAVLPVAARLDVTGNAAGMRRLGELGLLGTIAAAAPICAWGASFSEPIIRIWLNDTFSVYWPWQSLMFVVPLINAMTSFGGGALLNRPHAVAKLNALALGQIIIQFSLGLVLMGLYEERAFILGQVVAVFLSFPLQLRLYASEKDISWSLLRRHLGTLMVFSTLVVLSLSLGFASLISDIFALGLSLVIWMTISYLGMWFFVLQPNERQSILALIPQRFVRRGDKK